MIYKIKIKSAMPKDIKTVQDELESWTKTPMVKVNTHNIFWIDNYERSSQLNTFYLKTHTIISLGFQGSNELIQQSITCINYTK